MRLTQSQPLNQATPTTAALSLIPDGVAGVRATLKIMGEQVSIGKKNLLVRSLALSLIKNNSQKDWPGEIRDIHAYVRDHIRYVRDIRGVETIHSAAKVIEIGQGDCDDKSILLAALLESIGHPTRFIAIALNRRNAVDPVYEHVYVETKIGSKWIPLETTEPVAVGWGPSNVSHRLIYFN